MNMKKFLAPTSRDALRLIRIEMGADAVILSNRKVDGGVEIMALAGSELAQLTHEPRQPTPVAVRPAIVAQERIPVPAKAEPAISPISTMQQEQQGILSEIKFMRNMMQEQVDCLSWSDRQQRDPQRTRMLRGLLNAGFSAALTRQIVDKMPATANMEWVRRVLGNNLRIATKQEDLIVRGGVVALIGPTGVGKTTTTAKLAARAVVRYGADKVALLTTDSYRIGAHEQLRIYGKILGVTVHAVRDTEDLRLTLSGLKQKHLVLIDTIGMGQRDSRMAAQAEMFNATGVQRLLLLNATSSGDTLNDVVCMYNGAGVVGCIPTKLDEAVTFGTVLDVAMRHKLTLHYIANGQRVPEDLHEVNMEYLLHRAFKQSAKTAPFTLHELEFPALMAGVGTAPAMRGEYAT
ncbi:MAG: flagellar biosynthesis protein FlhF [Candidatus Nitrotoga sp.]|nr:flagellar biosynthesis protein FlhF [Candidatus Nitrotoga sp.]MDO9447641.1 flagellar biosynthesis protein FlhF [Candidatus Nitrotoga sp.]MDP1636539.1 flagellar biosynthesis protein FlhF [Candidatus Nitrotoga sp.]MDP1856370.1 flagellar biosynthesis protein FlhF [Candidatus Nitrotoga sp.]MDP3497851.1 flagellar biosynthesis protein FlhF [Candidatus Nitrotoga sp.]